MFDIGDKVVCIKESSVPRHCQYVEEIWPIVGETYTIRWVGPSRIPKCDYIVIQLVEIKNPMIDYDDGRMEMAFTAERFRKVIKKKAETNTSIGMDILRKIANNPNVKIKEDA